MGVADLNVPVNQDLERELLLFVSIHVFFNTLGMLFDCLFILIYSFYIIAVREFLSSVELLTIFMHF